MKKIISIVFILFVLNCRNNEVAAAKQNILDPANPISYSLFKLSSDLIGSSSSSCSSCGAAVSSNQPNSLIGFSDRIIIPSESNSSTNPSVWVLSDGINFTKFTVKIGDCVGAFSSTSSTVCVPRLVGYENGMYAVYGQKVTNSSGQQTIAAEYYGTGSNLNTINLTTTSPGGNANINSTFLYSAGKFHFYGCANNQCALYTTSDGSSWIASVGFSCELIYLADNGSPTCGLSRYFNGSTWVNAGTISGGANSSYSALYIDNIYRAWRNNSGTLSIFNSTS
ncbi:MAG TPA: hypothetical protein PLL86_22950, partial [Leptospiraceae bacterium]|nr:hypothetical protein [Leptospiraceae bacterium]